MKRSPKDRVGVLAELGSTGVGVGAGAAVSGTLASLAGATTIAGSTTLGSLLGGVFVAATPIGWVVGMAAVGGLLGYGLSRLSRSGGKSDIIKEKLIQALEKEIAKKRDAAAKTADPDVKMKKLISTIQSLVVSDALSQDRATGLLTAVQKGAVSPDQAFELVDELFKEQQYIDRPASSD